MGVEGSSGRPRIRWAAALIGLLAVSGLVAALWPSDVSPSGNVPVETEMSHVHGLGTNPADGTTYVATHSGVFRLAAGADPVRVAERYQDTMGFTVVGPDRFLASGHPDLTEASLPTHLGLIESTDAARTWQEVSLGGEADLHALDAGPAGVVAFDGLSGRLMSSRDGREWAVLAQGAVLDVAADPVRAGTVLVTTPKGELMRYVGSGRVEALPDAPAAVFVDWPRADLLVVAGPDGRLYRSDDAGRSFAAVGEPQGTLQAIDVTPESWLVATETAVLRSTDEGDTWERLVEFAS